MGNISVIPDGSFGLQLNHVSSGNKFDAIKGVVTNTSPTGTELNGLAFEAYNNHTVAIMRGSLSIAQHQANTAITNLYGAMAQAKSFTPGGSIFNFIGSGVYMETGGADSITNAFGFYTEGNIGAGVAENYYGLYLKAMAATNRWGVYQLDADAKNYFNGQVAIGTTDPTAELDINSDIIRLRTSKTPSSASDTGNQGDIAWDSDYIYICVATNTWKRSAIATW